MEQVYLLDKLNSRVDRKQVFDWLNCAADSSVYEDFAEEYQEISGEFPNLLKPTGILGFGQLSEAVATESYPVGTKVLYAVTTVGGEAGRASTKAFGEGNYVRGVLLDAAADVALFSLEEDLLKKVKEVCGIHHVGIAKRLEAPQDISIEVQREAWESLQLEERLGIKLTSGYMFEPVKTSCQVFVLSEDANVFRAQHDCRNCSNITCKMRKISGPEITVKSRGREVGFFLTEGETLMDGLLRESFYISAVCGGKGRCGKCKVQVLAGNAPVSRGDEKFFSSAEIKAGWRLSCLLRPMENLTIAFDLNHEDEFEAISEFVRGDKANDEFAEAGREKSIAIDIGTTTIAFQLLDGDGTELAAVTTINSQRKYGADVISRMQASIDGKREELQNCVRNDLQQGIKALLKDCEGGPLQPEQVERIAIACNTTMSHLLLGYPCDSLGVYPFTPVNIGLIRGSAREIIGLDTNAEVVILPGISTYVGGDIVAGLYACGFDQSDELCLLVDLGTNGEMALGSRDKILVTSTAAGPAFEGGNLTWGTGSVAGAICSVKLETAKSPKIGKSPEVIVKTIRDKAPIGICGTGAIETLAEMLREKIIDEMGLLEEEYFEEGFPLERTAEGEQIVLTQKDIRELQLAKAAVRAGIETLCLRFGVPKSRVARIYLAGGFGYGLDVEKAFAIGMLPEEFAGRMMAVGNSALAGAAKILRQGEGVEILQNIVSASEEISLSMDKDFNRFYMESMLFEEREQEEKEAKESPKTK